MGLSVESAADSIAEKGLTTNGGAATTIKAKNKKESAPAPVQGDAKANLPAQSKTLAKVKPLHAELADNDSDEPQIFKIDECHDIQKLSGNSESEHWRTSQSRDRVTLLNLSQ